MKIGIFYGSSSGNSEAIAEELEFYLKKEDVTSYNIKNGIENITDFKNIILIAPTYGVGELQKDWELRKKTLEKTNFSGKTVALIGLGNQFAFGESFIESIRILYDIVIKNNGRIVGFSSPNGYLFKESKAIINGHFVGLALDETNQGNKTPERIEIWLKNVMKEFKE
ncbi:flavodoxin [Fusobacterium sp. PH5-44]|uniref:flavodoxin n=1 Tax=unclassified Fusobacterium TaxID=2648384 RepID=UPI003D19792A